MSDQKFPEDKQQDFTCSSRRGFLKATTALTAIYTSNSKHIIVMTKRFKFNLDRKNKFKIHILVQKKVC
jgi:hypothetical protein